MNTDYITQAHPDYELLDSGDGFKLERFGTVRIVRPDPQILWKRGLDASEWEKASAVFDPNKKGKKWTIYSPLPAEWNMQTLGVSCTLDLSPFKHIGIFPEQIPEWQWLHDTIHKQVASGRKISVLNLFGYTGVASLVCAKAGAEVCHIDSSDFAVSWAQKNRDASGMTDAPIRYIVDDVRKFVEREIKRGKKYDVVLLDPPTYGKGVKNEVWNIEEDLLPLLSRVQKVLTDNPVAVMINGYASQYGHITYKQALETITKNMKGETVSGDLYIQESNSERLLKQGIFARFEGK